MDPKKRKGAESRFEAFFHYPLRSSDTFAGGRDSDYAYRTGSFAGRTTVRPVGLRAPFSKGAARPEHRLFLRYGRFRKLKCAGFPSSLRRRLRPPDRAHCRNAGSVAVSGRMKISVSGRRSRRRYPECRPFPHGAGARGFARSDRRSAPDCRQKIKISADDFISAEIFIPAVRNGALCPESDRAVCRA